MIHASIIPFGAIGSGLEMEQLQYWNCSAPFENILETNQVSISIDIA